MRDEEAQREKGQGPFGPRKGDTPVIARWREQMGTPAGQVIDRLRSSLAEHPNAVFRDRGLRQFVVRGLAGSAVTEGEATGHAT
ncbi:MAG TPA: hypothetical protein VL132_03500 [Planctomycetaceae bacterium]|nr:hypothetical protein [Planctomycetaceae bacterium]